MFADQYPHLRYDLLRSPKTLFTRIAGSGIVLREFDHRDVYRPMIRRFIGNSYKRGGGFQTCP
jgi:hypothetical protein